MKLTKVTWMLEWYSDTVNGVEHAVREAKKQVKEWSEDAEKYHKLNLCNECEQVNKYGIYEPKWTDKHTKIAKESDEKFKTHTKDQEVDI